jgi:hypothetical protein
MDLNTAIRNTIFNTVLAAYGMSTDDPSSSPYQNQNVIVGRLWPGQLIEESEYGNAWSPTSPTGKMAATENLSILVDPIPNISDWYSKSGRKVEEMYSFMLNSDVAVVEYKGLLNKPQMKAEMSFESSELPSKVESELAQLKTVEVLLSDHSKVQTIYMTPEAINKKNLEIAHSNAAAAALAHRLAWEKVQSKTASRARMTQIKPNQKLEEIKFKAWDDLQIASSTPLKLTTNTNSSGSIRRAFNIANLTFERSVVGSVRNPGISYHPSYTSPENWVSLGAIDNWPLLTMPVADTDSAVDLTIRFSRIDINRPWMVASLLDLDGWKNSQGPGSFSTGSFTQNNGTFALLPQSMIVARDIVAKTSTGGVEYSSLGLQVLAYISKLNPYAPPL